MMSEAEKLRDDIAQAHPGYMICVTEEAWWYRCASSVGVRRSWKASIYDDRDARGLVVYASADTIGKLRDQLSKKLLILPSFNSPRKFSIGNEVKTDNGRWGLVSSVWPDHHKGEWKYLVDLMESSPGMPFSDEYEEEQLTLVKKIMS